MNRYRLQLTSGLVALMALGLVGVAPAQEPGFPYPSGGPQGQEPQGQGPRGPMGQRGPMPELTAARIPTVVLASYLDLNDSQEKKIAAIHQEFIEKARSMRPRPPQGGGRPGQGGIDGPPQGGPPQGGPGGFGQGRPPQMSDEQRQKMEETEKKAQKAVEAELNDAQKKKLPELLKALTALQRDGIAPEVALKLKLTDTQMTKLAALGKEANPRKVERILTDEQSEYADAHRLQGPPMGGGPMGPPPGGPDF